MSLNAISATNLNYVDNPKNIIIVNDTSVGNILFTSEKHNLSPKVTGTLVAEEAADSSDSNPRIRVFQVDEDNNEVKTILRRKSAYFMFCFEDGSEAPQRISVATDRATMVSEVLTYLNDVFNRTAAVAASTLTFTAVDSLDAVRDNTNTTVLFDNGKSFSVNSIRAVENSTGLINILDHEHQSVLFENITHSNVTIAGNAAGNNVATVVNKLNNLFTVNPVGGSEVPTSSIPLNSGVDTTGTLAEGQTPITGSPTHLYTTAGDTSGHGARYWSNETINAAGEYFTVKITGEGRFILGLGDAVTDSNASGTADDIEEMQNNSGNGHSGVWWSQALYDYGSYRAPWTTYGSNAGLAYGPGWNGATTLQMRYNTDVQASFEDFTAILMKVGIMDSGHVGCWYFDEGRSNDWILTARSAQGLPSGEWFLVVKLWDQTSTLVEIPQVHEHAENAIGTGATSYNLLGNASVGVPASVVTISGGDSADFNDGFWTSETIDESGEFFEVTGHSGELAIGLVDTTAYDPATLDDQVRTDFRDGYYFGALVPSNGTQTTEGLLRDANLAGEGVAATFDAAVVDTHNRLRIGFDTTGRATLWVADHATNDSWVVSRRYGLVAPAGTYSLVIKSGQNDGMSVDTDNVSTGTLSTAPILTYYYVESPDGSFYYPLFNSAEEANYVDTQNGGSGSSHQHVFVDDTVPGRIWYMPDTGGFHDVGSAPTNTAEITWNEVVTQADNLFAPSLLNLQDRTFAENASVNIQLIPADSTPSVTVTGLPDGLSYANRYITGTTPYVPADAAYTVTVVRSNGYGSTSETFVFNITDNASLGDLTGFSETQGNMVQPNRIILTHDALLQYDTQINPGEELTYSYGSGANPPTIGILSTDGQTALDGFDPATDTLGTGNYDYAGQLNWALRYVSFGGDIGSNSGEFNLRGWDNNNTIQGSEGTNHGVEFKLEYGLDGYIKLYRGGTLLLTSVNTFAGAQTLTLAAFDDQAQSDVYIPSNFTITTTGAGTTTPPAGFTDPVESGEMASTTLFGNGTDSGVVFVTETLKVNHRYIVPRAWIEANVLPYIAGANASSSNDKQFLFGVGKSGVNWATVDVNHFHAAFRLEGTSSSHVSRFYYNNTSSNGVSIASTTNGFYDYAIEWDGTDLHLIACNVNDINTQPGLNNGGSFSRTATYSNFGFANQSLDLVIAVRNGGQVNLTTSGLQQIRIPLGARDVIVGEASGGGSMFALAPAASVYDSHSSGHASTTLGMSFDAPTLNAGYTYRFIYHPSLEAGDNIKFTRIDDGTDYTTGVTFFDGTSAGDPNFTDGYKGVTFAVPSDAPPLNVGYNNDYQGSTNYVLKPLPLSGSTYVVPVTGVTQEGPVANQTGSNIFDANDHGWLSIDEPLSAGERFIMDSTFLGDLALAMPDDSDMRIGLKDGAWTDAYASYFEGGTYLYIARYSATDARIRIYSNGSSTSTFFTTAAGVGGFEAFIEVTSSGNNIRIGLQSSSNSSDDASTTAYADWASAYKFQTGDQGYGITSVDVMVLGSGNLAGNAAGMDSADVDWTALSEVNVPTPAVTNDTNWTKALDFSGSSERLQQVNASYLYTPLKMGGTNNNTAAPTTAGYTSNDTNSRPWATAIVFRHDGNSSNQHVWNLGEGAGSTDDNIYLRLDASGNLYFGWGRSGELNECDMSYFTSFASNTWHGIYIAHNGTRLGGGHTASAIADCFDIHSVNLQTGAVGSNLSTTAAWTSGGFGARMNREFTGDMTIGGRGANRNFHGKVAAMVVTTLRTNVAMPTTAEIGTMVTDPVKWLNDYKVGNAYRRPSVATDTSNFQLNNLDPMSSTQVWLMGDGPSDSYAQIRNHVYPANQNRNPMNMVSMVSNDIETVSISGLT